LTVLFFRGIVPADRNGPRQYGHREEMGMGLNSLTTGNHHAHLKAYAAF